MKNWKYWAYIILCGLCGGLFAVGLKTIRIEVWALAVIAFISLVIAFCAVTDAKKERQKRWDETSQLLSTEKELEAEKQMGQYYAEAVLWYADELMKTKANFEQCRNGNMVLQDKLSAILCPRNDHVWVDGVCTKCGRMKDD